MSRRLLSSSANHHAHRSVANLVEHVDVKPLEAMGHFVGRSADLGWGRVYGGQTMAQGLAACQRLAGPERAVHNFSCNFLRAGDPAQDIIFEAEDLYHGRSFTSIHCRAKQSDKSILVMTASLQTPEDGLDYQDGGPGPEVTSPHELRSMYEHIYPHVSSQPKQLAMVDSLFGESAPFDIRPNEFVMMTDPTVRTDTRRATWIRARARLPDSSAVHERLLTYISDWGLLETCTHPHPTAPWLPQVQLASLSHSIHFHRPFRLDEEWLVHVMRCPSTSGARGLALGEFWSETGALVASTSQEGLMRMRSAGRA